jgi:hypothetical protein
VFEAGCVERRVKGEWDGNGWEWMGMDGMGWDLRVDRRFEARKRSDIERIEGGGKERRFERRRASEGKADGRRSYGRGTRGSWSSWRDGTSWLSRVEVLLGLRFAAWVKEKDKDRGS